MKYQIGQVAKLLDISAQGLRLYEKEGIVLPNREESGYRTYTRLDITSLLRARSYQKYGFSLQQVKELINTDDIHYLHDEYLNHEEVLRKSILMQQLELKRLTYTRQLINTFPENLWKIQIEERPALYRFEYMCDDHLLIDEKQYPILQKWISYAPLAFSSVRNDWKALENKKDIYYSGIAILKEDAEALEINELIEQADYLKSLPCLTTIVQVKDEKHLPFDYLDHVFKYIHDNQIKVIGDPISESIISYNKQNNYTRIRKIWIPIQI